MGSPRVASSPPEDALCLAALWQSGSRADLALAATALPTKHKGAAPEPPWDEKLHQADVLETDVGKSGLRVSAIIGLFADTGWQERAYIGGENKA